MSKKAEAYSWNDTRSYKVLRKNEKEVAAKCHMKNLMRKKYVIILLPQKIVWWWLGWKIDY